MREELRESLWVSLSELWLDTEIQPNGIHHLAGLVRDAECTPSELEEICRYELAPFLGGNLLVAGVWNGFDPDWVIEQAQRCRASSQSLTGRWRVRGASWWGGGVKRIEDDWSALLRAAYGRPASGFTSGGE